MNATKFFNGSVLLMTMGGCVFSNRKAEPLANGYVEVTYTRGYIHPTHQITLQYRNEDGTEVMIWPDNGATRVKGDIALFYASKAERSLRPSDDRWPMAPRIFAVKAPAPPLDITSEVIRVWSKESGKDYSESLAKARVVSIEQKGDAFEFRFAVWSPDPWPNDRTRVKWDELLAMMRDVQQNGVKHKDPRYGTAYIEKEVKFDSQK